MLGVAPTALADCANPTAKEGSIIYNADYHIPQYCNGTLWIAWGSGYSQSNGWTVSGTTVHYADGNVGIGTTSIATDGGLQPRLAIANPSDSTKWVGTGYDNAGDYGFIYAVDNSTSWKNLVLNPVSGNVGIGTTSPGATLHVKGTTGGQMYLQPTATGGWDGYIGFLNSAGTKQWNISSYNPDTSLYIQDSDSSHGVKLTQDSTSWASASDARLKTGISTLRVLDRLENVRAVSFTWKSNGHKDIGVIAQELYSAFPETVEKGSINGDVTRVTDSGVWMVKYDKLGALALEAVKELKAINDNQADEIEALKAEIKALKGASK